MPANIQRIVAAVVLVVAATTAMSSANASQSRYELESGYHGNTPAR
jgi:hypothetical protein